MRFSRLCLAVFCASALPLSDCLAERTTEGKPPGGVWSSVLGGLKAVGDGAGAVAKTATGAVTKVFDFSGPKKTGLRLELICDANPVRLGKGTLITVKLQVFNVGKKTRLLEFESGQRAETVLRDPTGKIVGRSFVSAGEEAGMVTLNSKERIEYLLKLPTNNLVAGKGYTLEAAITGQAGLVAKMPLSVAP